MQSILQGTLSEGEIVDLEGKIHSNRSMRAQSGWMVSVGLFLVTLPLRGDVFDDLKIDQKEIQSVRALADQLTELGFPDGAGAEFYVGKITVASTVDPAKEKPAFPVSQSTMQSTAPNGNLMEYRYVFGGFHTKLSDGTWFVGLNSRFTPDKKNVLDTSGAVRIDPATAFENALKEHPYDIQESSPDWVKAYPEAKREQLSKITDHAAPLLTYLNLNVNVAPLAVILLHRAGMKEAPIIIGGIADIRSRNFWQLSYWNAEPSSFDPTGVYEEQQALEGKWHDGNEGNYPWESFDVAFRRAAHRTLRQSLMTDNPLLQPATAAVLVKATLDKDDPQGIGRSVDLLLGGSKISETPANNASIKEKLAAWGLPGEPEMVVQKGKGGAANSISMSTMFVTPVPAYQPQEADLNKLFALIGDNSPTRWNDFQGGRNVGENALRAIAVLLNRNPLELVELDGLDPWTPERQKLAAEKLAKWWTANQSNYESFIVKEE